MVVTFARLARKNHKTQAMEKRIGCSGYHYDDWKGDFYPKDLPKKKWIEYYAEHFDTVELNNTFYNLPEKKTFKNWYDRTPDNFEFTVKGSRYITHMKKLKDVKTSVDDFYDAISPLQEKTGCILWQLPGNLHKNTGKLKQFCQWLSKSYKNVIEFRHNSWFDEEVYDILRKYKVIFCMISAPGDLEENTLNTTDTSYLRFHGKKEWYKYLYTEKELKSWKDRIESQDISGLYIYFNNDYDANSIKNARQIKEMF